MSKPRSKVRRSKARQCGSKVRYATLAEAEAAARRPFKLLSRIGYMTAYRCTACRMFHYGHPPTKR